MQTPWPHDLIGRTTIGVTQRIVAKVFFRINAFAASFASGRFAQELQMRSDPRLLTTN